MKNIVLALSLCLAGFVAPAHADHLKAGDRSSDLAAQKSAAYENWNAALESGAQISREQVHDNFANVIEENLSAPDADAIISRLTERELAAIATLHRTAPLRDASFESNLVARVGKAQKIRLSTAFSQAQQALKSGGGVVVNAVPTVDMTLHEIYLEFRTAPVGSLSVGGSLYETAAFAATRMSVAFTTGYAIGTGMAWIIETYSPGTWDTIGGTVYTATQNVMDAGDYMQRGEYLSALDAVFGSWQMDFGDAFGDYSGDWSLFNEYDFWMFCMANPHVC
jgi:hypothetical protein